MPEIVLQTNEISKYFTSGDGQLTVLDRISFDVEQGDSLSIMGPSGSGKTTLLALCAGLDVPSEGMVSLMGSSLNALDEDDRAYVRSQFVGFVFQNFQLLPSLTALENVMIPLELCGVRHAKDRGLALLDRVGLGARVSHYPSQLSGGEQQRVALARAFINNPKILFADEPTGNLDEHNADLMTELLLTMNKEQKTTLVLVTHDPALARKTNRMLRMKGGQAIEHMA